MADEQKLSRDALAGARINVPENVVFRSFEEETILLNLTSGNYHGLNRTGGRMLELLRETGSFTHTAEAVASEFDQPLDEVASDLTELCNALVGRGLVELDAGAQT